MKLYQFIGRRSAAFAFVGMLMCNLTAMFTDFGQKHFFELLVVTLLLFLLFFAIMLTFRCEICKKVIAINILGKVLDERKLGFQSEHSFYDLTCPDCRDH